MCLLKVAMNILASMSDVIQRSYLNMFRKQNSTCCTHKIEKFTQVTEEALSTLENWIPDKCKY